eukprot:1160343-Pelagomonas_calceolata.AAC.3
MLGPPTISTILLALYDTIYITPASARCLAPLQVSTALASTRVNRQKAWIKLEVAQRQHLDLRNDISGKAVTLHTILLGAGGACYDEHTTYITQAAWQQFPARSAVTLASASLPALDPTSQATLLVEGDLVAPALAGDPWERGAMASPGTKAQPVFVGANRRCRKFCCAGTPAAGACLLDVPLHSRYCRRLS